MNGRLVIVAGLPGSGKTTYLEKIKSRKNTAVYDDYRGHLLGRPNVPQFNEYFVPVLSGLQEGKEVWVCDIMFCISRYRNEFLMAIVQSFRDVQVDYVFFENNPAVCKQRVKTRNRSAEVVDRELKLIDEITEQYSVVGVNIVGVDDDRS